MARRSNRLRIALVLFPPQGPLMAETLHGILAYARHIGRWDLHPQVFSQRGIMELGQWRPDGIIAQVSPGYHLGLYQPLQCPLVEVYPGEPSGLPSVQVDDRAVGREAGRFFLSRRYRHVAYCGMTGRTWSAQRAAGLAEVLTEAGLELAGQYDFPLLWAKADVSREGDAPSEVSAWLAGLARPVAVVCGNDNLAVWLSEICAVLGLGIPEDVALMGADNDAILCQIPRVPLSSVPMPAWQIGYHSAELLASLMAGQAPPPTPVMLEPPPAVIRQSSDLFAVDDAEVRSALAFIRANLGRALRVADVVAATRLGRRALEQRFRAALGRTIRTEVERLNVERARDMLVSTDLKIEQVADNCGFADARRFGLAFRRLYRLTPRDFRHRHRRH